MLWCNKVVDRSKQGPKLVAVSPTFRHEIITAMIEANIIMTADIQNAFVQTGIDQSVKR